MTSQHQCIKLENISSIRYGRSINKAFIHEEKSLFMFIQSRDFSIDGIDWDRCSYTDFVGVKEHYFLEQGDILFFIRSEGDNAMVIDESINNVGSQVIAGPLMFILRCDTRKVLPEYLAWWLNQKPSQNYFKSKDYSGERKSIVRETLQDTPISIPSLEQQQKIIKNHNATLKEIAKLQSITVEMALDIKRDSLPLSNRFFDNYL